jgi:NAD(P)-dependent dehydrogenase (short-subunit alcohol dehydrogenase family)
MKRKTVIITGANAGIGKAAAHAIARLGHRVVLACRNPERAEAAQREIGGNAVAGLVDLARRRSIHAFTDWLHREIGEADVLINNAAHFDLSRTRRETTPDGFETVWFANHLAPVLLVDRLMDMLVASPQGRILNVSSLGLAMHPFLTVNLKDPMFGNRPYSVAKAYYQSKLAQLMHTLWLAQHLTGTMATANCIRVSNVRLDPKRYPGLPAWMKNLYAIKARFSIAPEQMAETYVRAALDDEAAAWSGAHVGHPLKKVGIPAYANDPLCIEQVMQLSYRQLGIQPSISYEPGDT